MTSKQEKLKKLREDKAGIEREIAELEEMDEKDFRIAELERELSDLKNAQKIKDIFKPVERPYCPEPFKLPERTRCIWSDDGSGGYHAA